MSDAKFTPGPWRNHPGINICRQYEAGLNVQYLMTSDDKRTEEGMANAHLIVAAPEMYSAIQNFVDRVDCGEIRSHKTYESFKSVLKKARGES